MVLFFGIYLPLVYSRIMNHKNEFCYIPRGRPSSKLLWPLFPLHWPLFFSSHCNGPFLLCMYCTLFANSRVALPTPTTRPSLLRTQGRLGSNLGSSLRKKCSKSTEQQAHPQRGFERKGIGLPDPWLEELHSTTPFPIQKRIQILVLQIVNQRSFLLLNRFKLRSKSLYKSNKSSTKGFPILITAPKSAGFEELFAPGSGSGRPLARTCNHAIYDLSFWPSLYKSGRTILRWWLPNFLS